jgi:predicted nucleic acid-binding protein
MRIVVSDTSPIRVLRHLNHLQLLGDLFDEILIPPAVARECGQASTQHLPVAVSDIPRARVVAPSNQLVVEELERHLQLGEAEAIALAQELGTELLIDELAGRRAAHARGVALTGVVGLLVRAKQRNLIPQVIPLIERARDEIGFFVTTKLIEQARQLASE